MPTLKDDLLSVAGEVDVYDEKKIVSTGMPLNHYVQESTLACNRLLRKKDVLAAAGMDFTIVEKVKVFAGACRQLQSEMTATFSSSENQIKWNALSEEADDLLYDMKEATVYACRAHEEIVAFAYATYNEGGSNSNKIQDLNDFSVNGFKNEALFIAAGYDMANFTRASELAREMSDLLAEVTLDRSENPEARIRRDKAFSIMKKLIDDLNDQARFILRSDKITAAKFRINPPRKKPTKKVPATESVQS
jgi:vacuolar-type H+-ATPase subunit I/STV1